MATTAIEWSDKVWNPVGGCKKVSSGCKNCYAEKMAARHVLMSAAQGRTSPYLPVVDARRRRWRGNFITLPERLADPLSWRKPQRVFVNSMSDLFGEGIPFEYIAACFGVMAATPHHTYQVLTKRPERMDEFFRWAAGFEGNNWLRDERRPNAPMQIHLCMEYFARQGPASLPFQGGVSNTWPLPNVWLGVSVEDQAEGDERIPLLLQVPAAIRFLSCEPLLGPLDLEAIAGVPAGSEGEGADYYHALRGFGFFSDGEPAASHGACLDWVICGGESGAGARPMQPEWPQSLRDQCDRAGVPFFFKQWGGINKKKAGRVLDGRTHDAYPEVRRAT